MYGVPYFVLRRWNEMEFKQMIAPEAVIRLVFYKFAIEDT